MKIAATVGDPSVVVSVRCKLCLQPGHREKNCWNNSANLNGRSLALRDAEKCQTNFHAGTSDAKHTSHDANANKATNFAKLRKNKKKSAERAGMCSRMPLTNSMLVESGLKSTWTPSRMHC